MNLSAQLGERLDRIERALALLRHPMPPPLLKPSEVAKALRVSERTVRRYIEAGELKASRFDLGRQFAYRIRQDDLAAFIEGARPAQKESRPVGGSRLLKVPTGLV